MGGRAWTSPAWTAAVIARQAGRQRWGLGRLLAPILALLVALSPLPPVLPGAPSPVRAAAPDPSPPSATPTPGPSPTEPTVTQAVSATASVILPYGAPGYRYKIVAYSDLPGFEAPSYDDVAGGFSDGTAGFGSYCSPPWSTNWSGLNDILLRKQLTLPAGATSVTVWVAIDNDVQVFWNGTDISGGLVSHEGCASYDALSFAVPANLLLAGGNLLAARGRNRDSGSPQFIDLKVTAVLPGGPPPEPTTEATEKLENGGTGGDPVQTFSGALLYSFTDVSIPGRGPTPTFTRSYNSADTRTGPIGPGWTHGYNARLRNPGDGSGDLLFVRPDGNTDRFTFNLDGSFSPSPATYATLVRNADSTYTVTEMDRFLWSFSSAGTLTALTDRYGNTSALGYDGAGQLTSIADPAGRGSLALGYTYGLLTSVSDWATPPRTVTYQYDANGRLWKVTNREGQTTTFAYDGTSSRLTTITDARGNVALTLTYDPQGRVQTQKDAQGLVTGQATTFVYVVNPDGTRETTVTSPPTSFEPSFAPAATDAYNAQGWLTSRVARPSSTETLTETYGYGANGFRTSVTDPRGTTTDLCYDVDSAGAPIAGSRGNLTRRIDPAPTPGGDRPVTLFAYDAMSNPTQIVAPKGVPSGTTVACATNLSAINPSYATDMAYDAAGATLLSTTTRFTDPELGPQTAVTTFQYADPANPGRITRTVPPRGNTGPSPDASYATTMTYAATGPQAGMLVGTTDALGNTTTYEYDPVGRQTKVGDPLGNAAGGVPADYTTEYVYDNEDRVRFVKLPSPTAGGSQLVTEIRYDEVGNRTVQIDANGQVTTSAYDERDGLVQVRESPLVWTDPAVPPAAVITTEYAYDAAGNLARMIRAEGDPAAERVTDYAYDGRGLVRRETQYPSWPSTSPTLVTTSGYDPAGNVSTIVDLLGRTTTSSYDALNRLTAVDYSDPATPDVTYAYDANGNRASMTDGTGTTTYAYDEADRLTAVTSPGPTTVAYRYDLDGNRTKLIYPDSTAVAYSFDKASRMSGLTDWASRQVGYAYWPDGALRTTTNPDASIATYTYDNARRLTDILDQQGTTTIGQYAYALDALGNVTGLQDGVQPTSYGLDRLYRLTSLTGPDGSRTYGYDPAGNRTSLAASGTTTYTYDRADRIVSLQAPPAPGSSTRPPASNDTGWAFGANAYLSDNAYATASPPKNGTTAISLGTFGFDATIPANATITAVTVTVEWKVSTTSSKATLGARAKLGDWPVGGELVNAGEPTSDLSQSFTVSGLTRTMLSGLGVVVRASRGASNTPFTASLDSVSVKVDYTVPGTMTLTSDANGNLTAKGSSTFTYDGANRLTSATVAGVTETYAYDGDGVRFSRRVGAGPVTRYVTDPAAGLPVTIEDGARKYVWGVSLAYAVSGSTLEIYHTDRLGSVRAITDAAGAITATYRTDEFGVPTASTGTSSQPFGFTGEPRDATGLTYLRARYYDPTVGRFMSRDSNGGRKAIPVSLNRYAYANGNPLRFVDPSGFGSTSQALRGAQPWPQAGFDPNTGIAPYMSGYDPLLFAKGGKQNIRDTGLIGVPDDEVSRRARDKSLSPQERLRYLMLAA